MSVKLDTRKLDQLISQVDPRAQAIVKGGAFSVEGKAKSLAPVDTGALKNSLHTEQKGPLLWWVADGVEYGIYQELGTSRMAAQPFMTPAVEWVRPQFNKQWRELCR